MGHPVRTYALLQPSASPPARASGAIGVELVALGERARSVFGDCRQVRHDPGGEHVDLVLADSARQAEHIDAPRVVLTENLPLAVPAFDHLMHNPIGWIGNVQNRVAALGPRHLLPPDIKTHVTAGFADVEVLRDCHHAVDVQAYHADTLQRAGALVRLLATGVPVYLADREPELGELLGSGLYELLTTDLSDADERSRELASIRMRRCALRDHTKKSRARQIAQGRLPDPPTPPRVSILLATNRPHRLAWAMANVGRQNYPCLELVLATHGEGFDAGILARVAERFAMPATVVPVAADRPLGTVLNVAARAATGTLLTKMDDDDLYGPDHVWDLVLAHDYSGANLVGKEMEFVFLGKANRTIRQWPTGRETFCRRVAGGALLMSRHDFDHIGGWRRVHRAVDAALIEDVHRAGATVYRTHSAGFMHVRHEHGHTWDVTEQRLLRESVMQIPGWCPSLAGIEDIPPPIGLGAPNSD